MESGRCRITCGTSRLRGVEGGAGKKSGSKPLHSKESAWDCGCACQAGGAASCASTKKRHRPKDRPLRTTWDEELEGAGDDAELDGEAGERLAVDLGVDRI